MFEIGDGPAKAGNHSGPDAPLDRRAMIKRVAAVSAAGVACTAAPAAFAAAPEVGPAIFTYDRGYAVADGTLIRGYYAAPRGKTNLDVLVLVTESGLAHADAQAKARRYAQAGYIVFAPDLHATYGRDPLGGRDDQMARLSATASALKKLPRGSGNVKVLAV